MSLLVSHFKPFHTEENFKTGSRGWLVGYLPAVLADVRLLQGLLAGVVDAVQAQRGGRGEGLVAGVARVARGLRAVWRVMGPLVPPQVTGQQEGLAAGGVRAGVQLQTGVRPAVYH